MTPGGPVSIPDGALKEHGQLLPKSALLSFGPTPRPVQGGPHQLQPDTASNSHGARRASTRPPEGVSTRPDARISPEAPGGGPPPGGLVHRRRLVAAPHQVRQGGRRPRRRAPPPRSSPGRRGSSSRRPSARRRARAPGSPGSFAPSPRHAAPWRDGARRGAALPPAVGVSPPPLRSLHTPGRRVGVQGDQHPPARLPRGLPRRGVPSTLRSGARTGPRRVRPEATGPSTPRERALQPVAMSGQPHRGKLTRPRRTAGPRLRSSGPLPTWRLVAKSAAVAVPMGWRGQVESRERGAPAPVPPPSAARPGAPDRPPDQEPAPAQKQAGWSPPPDGLPDARRRRGPQLMRRVEE